MENEMRKEEIRNLNIVCTLLSAFWTSYQIFKKEGGGDGAWQDPNFLRRVAGKTRGDLLQGGDNFYIKNKLNSEYSMTKKLIKLKKMFFSVITENSNYEIWAKYLVTFKDKIGLRMRNFNIFGVHWKIWFLGRSWKTSIEGGIA